MITSLHDYLITTILSTLNQKAQECELSLSVKPASHWPQLGGLFRPTRLQHTPQSSPTEENHNKIMNLLRYMYDTHMANMARDHLLDGWPASVNLVLCDTFFFILKLCYEYIYTASFPKTNTCTQTQLHTHTPGKKVGGVCGECQHCAPLHKQK